MSFRLVVVARGVTAVADWTPAGSAVFGNGSITAELRRLLDREFVEVLGFPAKTVRASMGSPAAFFAVARLLSETLGAQVVVQRISANVAVQSPARVRDFESARVARAFLAAFTLADEHKRESEERLLQSAVSNFESVTTSQMTRAKRFGCEASYRRRLLAAHGRVRRGSLVPSGTGEVFQSPRLTKTQGRRAVGQQNLQVWEQGALSRRVVSASDQELRHVG